MMSVLLAPWSSHHLSFVAVGKDPAVEAFTAKHAVEVLDEGVLPGTAGLDIHRVAVTIPQPLLKGIGNELWATLPAARCDIPACD